MTALSQGTGHTASTPKKGEETKSSWPEEPKASQKGYSYRSWGPETSTFIYHLFIQSQLSLSASQVFVFVFVFVLVFVFVFFHALISGPAFLDLGSSLFAFRFQPCFKIQSIKLRLIGVLDALRQMTIVVLFFIA